MIYNYLQQLIGGNLFVGSGVLPPPRNQDRQNPCSSKLFWELNKNQTPGSRAKIPAAQTPGPKYQENQNK
jgi:hypothetical protein